MSEHATPATHHVKRRGRIRDCEWCGQKIEIGEPYSKWLWFDGGDRTTVYAHHECEEAWTRESTETHEIVYAYYDAERPERKPND